MKVAGTVYRRSRGRGRRPSETTRSNDAWVTPFLDVRPSSNSPDMPGYAGVIVLSPSNPESGIPAGARPRAPRFPPSAADGPALPAPGSGRVYDNGFADNAKPFGSPCDSTRLLLVSVGATARRRGPRPRWPGGGSPRGDGVGARWHPAPGRYPDAPARPVHAVHVGPDRQPSPAATAGPSRGGAEGGARCPPRPLRRGSRGSAAWRPGRHNRPEKPRRGDGPPRRRRSKDQGSYKGSRSARWREIVYWRLPTF